MATKYEAWEEAERFWEKYKMNLGYHDAKNSVVIVMSRPGGFVTGVNSHVTRMEAKCDYFRGIGYRIHAIITKNGITRMEE